MALPLMAKATAVWLVENTALTFQQIADFCGLHLLEIQAMADGEINSSIQGLDPIQNGQISKEELDRCQADPKNSLQLLKPDIPLPSSRTKGPRYTPIAKRQDKPNGIAWLVRNHPELSNPQISKLIGTTKPTIEAIRSKTHWNMANIEPQHPVHLGLCSFTELDALLKIARERARQAGQPIGLTPEELAAEQEAAEHDVFERPSFLSGQAVEEEPEITETAESVFGVSEAAPVEEEEELRPEDVFKSE